MSKISKRVREQAAIYCSAMASWWAAQRPNEHFTKASKDVSQIAHAAHKATGIWPKPRSKKAEANRVHSEAWTKAEALLRTGWAPK